MELTTLHAFSDELQKLAELTPAERSTLDEIRRKQSEFETMSAKGVLSDAQKEQMRINTERLKAYLDKSRGKTTSVPGWARKAGGTPPSSSSSIPRGGSYNSPNPHGFWGEGTPIGNTPLRYNKTWGTIGAGLGGLMGGLAGSHMAARTDKQKEKAKAQKGTLGRFEVDHPVLVNAGLGALGGAASGLRVGSGINPFSTVVPSLASYAPRLAWNKADEHLFGGKKNKAKHKADMKAERAEKKRLAQTG